MADVVRKGESVHPMHHAPPTEAMNAAITTVPLTYLSLSLDLISVRFHRRVFREEMQKGFDYLKRRTERVVTCA